MTNSIHNEQKRFSDISHKLYEAKYRLYVRRYRMKDALRMLDMAEWKLKKIYCVADDRMTAYIRLRTGKTLTDMAKEAFRKCVTLQDHMRMLAGFIKFHRDATISPHPKAESSTKSFLKKVTRRATAKTSPARSNKDKRWIDAAHQHADKLYNQTAYIMRTFKTLNITSISNKPISGWREVTTQLNNTIAETERVIGEIGARVGVEACNINTDNFTTDTKCDVVRNEKISTLLAEIRKNNSIMYENVVNRSRVIWDEKERLSRMQIFAVTTRKDKIRNFLDNFTAFKSTRDSHRESVIMFESELSQKMKIFKKINLDDVVRNSEETGMKAQQLEQKLSSKRRNKEEIPKPKKSRKEDYGKIQIVVQNMETKKKMYENDIRDTLEKLQVMGTNLTSITEKIAKIKQQIQEGKKWIYKVQRQGRLSNCFRFTDTSPPLTFGPYSGDTATRDVRFEFEQPVRDNVSLVEITRDYTIAPYKIYNLSINSDSSAAYLTFDDLMEATNSKRLSVSLNSSILWHQIGVRDNINAKIHVIVDGTETTFKYKGYTEWNWWNAVYDGPTNVTLSPTSPNSVQISLVAINDKLVTPTDAISSSTNLPTCILPAIPPAPPPPLLPPPPPPIRHFEQL